MSELKLEDLDPDEAVLGETSLTIDIEHRATLAAVSLSMGRQCAQTLTIVSRHLDPTIYDNDPFAEAVKDMVLSNRYARIRLFVVDSRPLISTGHRMLELSSRLASFIEIRAPSRLHKRFNEAILVADNVGYIHRQFSDRFEGTASFSDKRVAKSLAARVEEMWARGVPDTNFRRLHI